MTDLQAVFESAGQLLWALAGFGGSVFSLLALHGAALSWILFFLFVVRWPDLREQLAKGAWAAVVLLYVVVSLAWGLNTKPSFLTFDSDLGSQAMSVIEKFVLTGIWIGVAFICGALQDHWQFTPAEVEIAGPPEGVAAGGHGHGSHGGHHGGHGGHH